MTYAAPAPTEPYLVLTPAGVLRAYAQREPDATCLQLQSLMDGAVAPRRSAWLAAGEDRDALLAEAMAAGWVQEATRRLIAPDVQLDDYLPRAIAGLSGTRTAAIASDDGFCLARVGYSQAEADTLCVMAADFSDFARRQHARGWTGTGRAVAFHESIDMLMPACSIVQFWVDGNGYWLILGGEPLLNNRALVDLAWGLRIAGNKFSAR